MKQLHRKRLVLGSETVRVLADTDLTVIAGGMISNSNLTCTPQCETRIGCPSQIVTCGRCTSQGEAGC